ncbi:putative ribonuclease H-like domain-containing protein [Tanacetum coccineum]
MSTSNNSTNSNQQTLAESGANERPPMLEKGNYIPWESRFRRFLDNKLEDGERMWNSIQNGPYQRPMVVDPTNPTVPILEPLSKMIEGNKKQYITNVRVMNYLLQAIPNDIYNSVDACKNAKEMWERIKRLMHGSEITTRVRHSRLMDEFDKFAAKEGKSLDFVHERLTTLVNIMDCNNVCPIPVAINTKFLNCLQPEWSKYVTMVRHNQTGSAVSYDVLYDSIVQFEPHDGRVDIQTKNAGYGGNANKNVGRNRTQGFNTGNAGDESNQIIQRVLQTESTPGKENVQCYNCNEKAMKDEAGSNISNEENDFMLATSYGEDLEELTAAVMVMARLQLANDNAENIPSYDAKPVSLVIQLVLWIVDSGCSKHMTGNLQLLRNFVEKFMGTVHFGNGHFAAITCYGDYGKSKKASLPPKLVPSIESKLELLHMDLISVGRSHCYCLLYSESFYCTHWHNKTKYELICGRKPNVQYFHVFGSLCYPTNDRDDLGKMKPKADIGIFVGYSESSRGFCIYNRRTKKIMETIHVKFDELTAMASECNNLEPGMNYMNFNDSSEDSQSVPSTSDLDNLCYPSCTILLVGSHFYRSNSISLFKV